MSYLLGFGIPIGYIVMGFYWSRAMYRSRYKRLRYSYKWNSIDNTFGCGFMVILWPVMGPIYFLTVACQNATKGNLFVRFYNHKLPETAREKRNREYEEKQAMQTRIRDLERELGIGPYAKTASTVKSRRTKVERYG